MELPVINTHIDKKIATTNFVCNLIECKGACCTSSGGRGAPLKNSEVSQIKDAIEPALKYLSEKSRKIILGTGAIEGRHGEYHTRCINNKDCVFVYYDENKVAKCSIEKAYFNKETEFRKPISCHLFPIRVTERLSGHYFNYEEIEECHAALLNGTKLNVKIYEFLEEALTRAYGEKFYESFRNECENILNKAV